jgi:hypothetical protein
MDGYQSVKGVFQLGSRYPKQVARVRIGVGVWLLFLTAILYSSGKGGGWAWLLVVAAALHSGSRTGCSGSQPNGSRSTPEGEGVR